ncbi:MAG: hypothetical protein E7273_03765 [Pseudobutyrivibrio ruminis]|nr:hypothetical protein [Pseudobutyrivibrio ruminis]
MDNLRKVSTDGLELIAKGRTASVYAYSETEVLKVYFSFFPEEDILLQWDNTLKVTEIGIPCAKALELVQVGDSIGVIYERIYGETLSDLLTKAWLSDNKEIGRLLDFYVSFAKSLHEKEFPVGTFEDIKEHYQKKINKVTGVFISEENAKKLSTFIDDIPTSTHYLHGDLNQSNIILLSDRSVKMVDVGDAAQGDPLFDFCFLSGMVFLNRIIPSFSMKNCGLSDEESEELYRLTISRYYNEANEEELQSILKKGKLLGIVYGVTIGFGEGDFIPLIKKAVDKIVSEEF